MTFLSRQYDVLRHEIAGKLQRSYLTYISNKMLFFNLYKLAQPNDKDPEGKELRKVLG